MIYATCSPHISETTVVVDRVRANAARAGVNSDVIDLSSHLGVVPGINNSTQLMWLMQGQKYLRLWPHLHSTDGMFVAALRRI